MRDLAQALRHGPRGLIFDQQALEAWALRAANTGDGAHLFAQLQEVLGFAAFLAHKEAPHAAMQLVAATQAWAARLAALATGRSAA